MSRKKYITMPIDENGTTPKGRFIVEGIEIIEEKKYPNKKEINKVCFVSRPERIAERLPTLVISSIVVELPCQLNNLPIGFVNARTFTSIWMWLWKNEIYPCNFPILKNTMFSLSDDLTWYSHGINIIFFDIRKKTYIKTNETLLDFEINF